MKRVSRLSVSLPALVSLLVGLIGLPATESAEAQAIDWIETRIRLEGEIQQAEVNRYFETRRLAQEAEVQADELQRTFDQRLRGGETSADELDRIVDQLDRARREQSAAEERARTLRQRLIDRKRQIEVFQAELKRLQGPRSRIPDPLSGTWRITMEPGGGTGTVRLRLDGTLISGSFAFADGTTGSVRGTFVNRRVRLERISSQAGLDMVFQGFYDRGTGDLRGGWQPTIHGQGGSGGGSWLAVRQRNDDQQDESEGGA